MEQGDTPEESGPVKKASHGSLGTSKKLRISISLAFQWHTVPNFHHDSYTQHCNAALSPHANKPFQKRNRGTFLAYYQSY